MSTGWLMNVHHDQLDRDWPVWLVTLITTVVVLKTRIHLLWLLSVGAVLGIIGWV
jgi:chromate transporter